MASIFRNLRVRFQILGARFTQGWRWFLGQLRDVQIAITLDLLIMVVAVALNVLLESNKPTRYAMIPCFLLALYVTRKLAIPVWFGELGLKLADKVVGVLDSWFDTLRSNLPSWMTTVVGRSDVHHTTHATVEHHTVVWHEASVGGHIFHVIGTVAMWKNVFLLACSLFPIWEKDWLSAIVMLTVIIFYFVWTEDFVQIKKWRKRLAYAVLLIAAYFMVPMTVRTVAPGTYHYLAEFMGFQDGGHDVEAERLSSVSEELIELKRQNIALERQYQRLHVNQGHTTYDADWQQWHSDQWARNTARIEEIESGFQPKRSNISPKSWLPDLDDPESIINLLFWLAVLAVLVGFARQLITLFKGGSQSVSAGHH